MANNRWNTDGLFSVELQMQDGQVSDISNGQDNETIQKLAPVLSKFPDQYAELVINFNSQGYSTPASMYGGPDHLGWPEEGDDERTLIGAYLEGVGKVHFDIPPELANELFDQYIEQIHEVELSDYDDDPGYDDDPPMSWDEDVQKIARVITEDPNVPNVYGDSEEDDTPLKPGEFRPKFSTRRLHRQILVVAKTRMEGAWSAYIFPVPGENHDEEAKLWQTEGVKLPENLARVMFPEFKDLKYAR